MINAGFRYVCGDFARNEKSKQIINMIVLASYFE